MLILAIFAGCIQDAPFPYVGKCAGYPQGSYDYGEIDIGTCLAGPTELQFTTDDADQPVLLVTNANPYQIFTGGSLLALPWTNLDPTTGRNVVTDLDPGAAPLPDFAGGLAVDGDLGLVAVRLSEDALVRQSYDDVFAIDLSDPTHPTLSDRGTDGEATVQVESDPNDVVIDPSTGFAYVANRTSHSVSVLDITTHEIEVVPPWPEYVLTSATFDDADASGSSAELADITVVDETLIPDDTWTLSWVAGTWRLWIPGGEGTWRTQTTGNGQYEDSAIGVELDPADTDGEVAEVADPYFYASTGRMYFSDAGAIRSAVSGEFLGDWGFESGDVLTGREGKWDATLGGPSATASLEGLWLFYDGSDSADLSGGIGAAMAPDGATFSRVSSDPLIEPTWDHEAEGIADPHVVYDGETDLWRMYYSAFDGDRWTVGHATSSDLLTWTSDEAPIFAIDGVDVAAPAVTSSVGSWRMWYARRVADSWSIGAAESPDGTNWIDLGEVLTLDDLAASAEQPPGPAVQASVTNGFRVEGENAGSLYYTATPGTGFSALAYGWDARVVAGAWLSPGDAGPDSAGGIRVGSVDLGAGLAWLTITDEGGTDRVGLADIQPDGTLVPREGAVFEGTDGFDRDGTTIPVVVSDGAGGWRMYYGGRRNSKTTVGLAVSSDGVTWSRVGKVLGTGDEWDSASVMPGSIEVTGDRVRLWYSGSDGEIWRVGTAISEDGENFTRESGSSRDWTLSTGKPGEWDDSGVRDPWVLAGTDADGNDGLHMWYAGYDGDTWRGGYAFRPDGGDFERSVTTTTDETRAVIPASGGMFHPDGVVRPILVPATSLLGAGNAWAGWYTGLDNDVARVGGIVGLQADRLQRTPNLPTLGDTLSFSTERGDPAAEAIPLDTVVQGQYIYGVGLTALSLDEERGFLYAASKLSNYIIVIDVRDDSTDDFEDLNYLDVEAVMPVDTSSRAQGFRQVVAVPGTNRLYALNDAPEGVYVLDISALTDEAWGRPVYDTLVGWLPASRGAEKDVGVDSQTSIGPAQMLIHPDDRRLFVSNFNANSLSVYDLSLGPYGQLVAEIPDLGENPYGIALTPDGRQVVVANYAGEVDANDLTEATLAVVDVDEDSPDYLQVLTWVVNR